MRLQLLAAFVFLIVGVFNSSSSRAENLPVLPSAVNWTVFSQKNEMTDVESYYAALVSVNVEATSKIIIANSNLSILLPEKPNNHIALVLSAGSFDCYNIYCTVDVRFADEKVKTYVAQSSSANVIVLKGEGKLRRRLIKESNSVKIAVKLLSVGEKVFRFNVVPLESDKFAQ